MYGSKLPKPIKISHVPMVSAEDLVLKHNTPTVKFRKQSVEKKDDLSEDWKTYDNIRVIGRFRPCNKREIRYCKTENKSDKPPVFKSVQIVQLQRAIKSSSLLSNTSHSSRPYECVLDRILPPSSTQSDVFKIVGKPMINAVLEGFNATVFAYGQSGSGKS